MIENALKLLWGVFLILSGCSFLALIGYYAIKFTSEEFKK